MCIARILREVCPTRLTIRQRNILKRLNFSTPAQIEAGDCRPDLTDNRFENSPTPNDLRLFLIPQGGAEHEVKQANANRVLAQVTAFGDSQQGNQ